MAKLAGIFAEDYEEKLILKGFPEVFCRLRVLLAGAPGWRTFYVTDEARTVDQFLAAGGEVRPGVLLSLADTRKPGEKVGLRRESVLAWRAEEWTRTRFAAGLASPLYWRDDDPTDE